MKTKINNKGKKFGVLGKRAEKKPKAPSREAKYNCVHGNPTKDCDKCKKVLFCEHNKRKRICRKCGSENYCSHNKLRSACVDCRGGSICFHLKIRSVCIECSPHNFCLHGRNKWKCLICSRPPLSIKLAASDNPVSTFELDYSFSLEVDAYSKLIDKEYLSPISSMFGLEI